MVDPIGGVVTWKRVAARQRNATTGSGRRRAVVSERFFGRLFVVTSVNAREKNGDLVDDRNALPRKGMCSANAIAHWQNSGVVDNRRCAAENNDLLSERHRALAKQCSG